MKSLRVLRVLIIFLLGYFIAAYLLIPDFWKHYAPHPELEGFPKTSFTSEGLFGDPLNTGLVGSEEEIIKAMKLSGWQPADSLKIAADFKIAESVLLHESYPDAPVSKLFLFNRSQDLAFEKQVGGSARQRHHVRFWKTEISDQEKRLLWVGSATFDQSVGISHRTGQITHHIAPDIDKERDTLIEDLSAAGQLVKIYQVSGIGPQLKGKNGNGDSYYTDGEMTLGVIAAENKVHPKPSKETNPVSVELKNRSWDLLKLFLQKQNS